MPRLVAAALACSACWLKVPRVSGALPTAFPGCVESGVVMRHADAFGIFVDVRGWGNAGCWLNDCEKTDKFIVADKAVCARACASVPQCTHWSVGVQEDATRCFLRKSDGGRDENVDEKWSSGVKACTPKPLPDGATALSIARLPALQACDNGKSVLCPDLKAATETWRLALADLQRAARGRIDDQSMMYINQVASDTNTLAREFSEENFARVAHNNRLVFDALLAFLEGRAKFTVDSTDASLPSPFRGRLCGATSCYVDS
eukprot:TRINITY_DN58358_c0_g1_i1.p1 TRINITY_DN58358_c0_g1~~TRINITY_DN58358_c0_g1_i1.p1  ORF type:complete len:285 (+),score=48.09 TRINITY_DN58358_c0_g1_i1:74-856(+)